MIRKIVAIAALIGIICTAAMCIEKPEHTITGAGGEYHFDNGICEDLTINGHFNTVYVDTCDDVSANGLGNRIVRR